MRPLHVNLLARHRSLPADAWMGPAGTSGTDGPATSATRVALVAGRCMDGPSRNVRDGWARDERDSSCTRRRLLEERDQLERSGRRGPRGVGLELHSSPAAEGMGPAEDPWRTDSSCTRRRLLEDCWTHPTTDQYPHILDPTTSRILLICLQQDNLPQSAIGFLLGAVGGKDDLKEELLMMGVGRGAARRAG